jgi:hypothetical protein
LQDSHHGGNALSFNGSTSNVVIPANAGVLGGNPRTFLAWVKQTSTPGGLVAFFSYGVAATAQQFVFYTSVTQAGDLYFAGNGEDWRTSAGSLITNNVWNQVAVTYNGGVMDVAGSLLIYFNGASQVLILAGGTSVFLNTQSSPVHIGDDVTTAGRLFPGLIEGARFYNRALDAVEIAQLYAEPYAGIVDAAASIIEPTTLVPTLPLMGQIWLA